MKTLDGLMELELPELLTEENAEFVENYRAGFMVPISNLNWLRGKFEDISSPTFDIVKLMREGRVTRGDDVYSNDESNILIYVGGWQVLNEPIDASWSTLNERVALDEVFRALEGRKHAAVLAQKRLDTAKQLKEILTRPPITE